MIPDFGHHTPFILASYAIEAVVICLLVAWLVWDGRRQQAALDALEGFRKSGGRFSDKKSEETKD